MNQITIDLATMTFLVPEGAVHLRYHHGLRHARKDESAWRIGDAGVLVTEGDRQAVTIVKDYRDLAEIGYAP